MSIRPIAVIAAVCLSIPIAANAASSLPLSLTQGATLGSAIPFASHAAVAADYGHLPLQFERNDGQTNGNVKFLSHSGGSTLFLTASNAVLTINRTIQRGTPFSVLNPLPWTGLDTETHVTSVLHMNPVGVNHNAQVVGLQKLPGVVNYFIGNDPNKWHSNIPTYQQVKYADIYKNVDLIYHGDGAQLEYDFVVRPGGDPSKVALAFTGAKSMRLTSGGDLVLATAAGDVTWRKPVVYQERDDRRVPIIGDYAVANGTVRFNVASYDAKLPLVIDPLLVYSTYLGGSNGSSGEETTGIAVDASGSAYVTGFTDATNYPVANAAQEKYAGGGYDTYISKLSAGGNALEYSTYVGGSGDDAGRGIAVDSSDNAYVVGLTNSKNFPTRNAYSSSLNGTYNVFVLKLDPTGSGLDYSTYIGGTGNEAAKSIAVDSAGCAFITGITTSHDYPVVNAYMGGRENPNGNAFITKIGASGSSLVYSTYLGGNTIDIGYDIVVDNKDEAVVTGTTESTNFPVHDEFQKTIGGKENVFVTKFTAAGNKLVFSTYLGGNDQETGTTGIYDIGYGVAVDSSDNVYVTGSTASTNFPVLNARQSTLDGSSDAFVAKFTASGTLSYSTYFGGSNLEIGSGIAVDPWGDAFVCGETNSTDFPCKDYFSKRLRGPANIFVAEISQSGEGLVYSTLFGGTRSDDAGGIAVDSLGNAYVGGFTTSVNLPILNAVQGTNPEGSTSGASTGFLVKFLGPLYTLLWTNTDGEFAPWELNVAGRNTTAFNPTSGWNPIAMASGPDNQPRVLIDHTADHQFSVWVINTDYSISDAAYGPYVGWRPVDITITSDMHIHILMDHSPDHQFSIWDMTSSTVYTSTSYGPYPGWQALKIAAGPDGHIHVLVDHTADHQTALWDVASSTNFTDPSFGPYSGWQATSIAVGPDNHLHVLWVHPADGKASVWDVASPTSITNPTYGPVSGYTATAVSVSADNHVHLGWESANNELSLWDFSSSSSYTTPTYGPYSGWSCLEPGTH